MGVLHLQWLARWVGSCGGFEVTDVRDVCLVTLKGRRGTGLHSARCHRLRILSGYVRSP
jgi:hypothetical protein